jgi:hypothetical protein
MTVAFSSIILLDNILIELKVRTKLILGAVNERLSMEECIFAK